MKNKIISLALLTSTTSLMAMYAEQASLYKDPRIMGMGGANVAVGAYSTSVFSNPAGLANIKKEHGLVVDILNVGLSSSSDFGDFASDYKDADDIEDDDEKADALNDVFNKYSGQNFHTGADTYLSVSKNSDMFSWSVGILAASDVNVMVHGNGSSNNELLETTSRVYGGVVVGVAKPYETELGHLDVGMSLKYISQNSYEGSLGISELTEDDEDESTEDKIKDRYEEQSSGIGLDIGVTFKPFTESIWHPAVGFSVLNIGSIDLDDNYGGQPLTVNMGVAISPEVKYIDKLVFAVDYVDIFNANKLRIYNYNDDGDTVDYTDYETSDFIKHLRVGTSVGLIDSPYFSTTLNGGLYQGSYTAGLDMDIFLLKLNVATYEEQVGDATTDIADRRYMAKIGFGW